MSVEAMGQKATEKELRAIVEKQQAKEVSAECQMKCPSYR
jgi:hypothetical protein